MFSNPLCCVESQGGRRCFWLQGTSLWWPSPLQPDLSLSLTPSTNQTVCFRLMCLVSIAMGSPLAGVDAVGVDGGQITTLKRHQSLAPCPNWMRAYDCRLHRTLSIHSGSVKFTFVTSCTLTTLLWLCVQPSFQRERLKINRNMGFDKKRSIKPHRVQLGHSNRKQGNRTAFSRVARVPSLASHPLRTRYERPAAVPLPWDWQSGRSCWSDFQVAFRWDQSSEGKRSYTVLYWNDDWKTHVRKHPSRHPTLWLNLQRNGESTRQTINVPALFNSTFCTTPGPAFHKLTENWLKHRVSQMKYRIHK